MRLRISHDALGAVLGVVHRGLATNLLLILTTAPFTLVLLGSDLARTWPALVLLAPSSFPAFVAACAVFSGGDDGVVRTFLRAWRASLRRGTATGAISTAALTVLAVDVRVVFGHPAGAAAIPVLLVLGVLVAATTVHVVVALADAPTARLRDIARWSAYLAVRRWYLTAVSLFVLVVLGGFVVARPALALGVAAAPLLYAAWANTRYALRPALGDVPDPRAVAAA